MKQDIVIFIVQAIIFAMQAWIALLMYRYTKKTESTYNSDMMFLELEKTLISNPKLYDFYNIGSDKDKKYWASLSEDLKRLYILNEMHYFHLAFIYRETKAGRVSKEYWKINQRWLEKLIDYSPLFMDIHKREDNMFEKEFKDLIDNIIVKRTIVPDREDQVQ